MDRISELPEPILQHILSFLPFKQVFQCAILAKRWKHVWSTFPILRFDHTYFNSLSKMAKGRDVWLKRGDLYSFVEQNLESRRTQRLLVKNFTLSDRLGRQKSASGVDRWLSFALESNVEELNLDFERFASVCYCLPQSVLLSKSLILLSLQRCKFDTSSTGGLVNMSSLRKVCLVEVHMGNQFLQKLVVGCPALEDMNLKWCYGLKGIELSCQHRLMAIGIEENRDLERVELKAPNLCSVHIVQTSCEINLVHCKNLNKLKLQACITDDWLNDHLSELPLIETLELTCCSLLKRIEISSDQLKSLALLACWNLVEVKLDAPKLCRFNHYTRSVISLSSSNALNLSVATYGIISPDVP